MSLVACPKCGEFIQSTDDVCPKCNCNIRHWNLSGFYFSPEFHAPFKCDNEDYDGEYFLHVIPQSDSSGQLYFLSGKSKDDWRNERPVNYSYIGDEIRTEGKYYDKKIYHDQILYDEEYIYEGYIPEIQYFDVTCFDKTHEFHFRNDGLVEVTLISQKDSSKKRIGVGPYLRYKEFIITCYADCRWNEFVDRIFVVINHQIHLLAYVKEDKCKEVRDYANSLKERFHNIVLEIPQIDSPLNGFYRYIPSFLNGISGAYLSLISRGINRGIVYRVHKTNAGDFDDGLMDFTTRKNLELGKRWRDEYEDYYRVEGANVLVSLEPGGEPYYKLEIYTPDILLTEANLDFEGYIPDGERFCANCNINDGTFHWKLSFADDGTVVISDKRETVSGYYFVFEEILVVMGTIVKEFIVKDHMLFPSAYIRDDLSERLQQKFNEIKKIMANRDIEKENSEKRRLEEKKRCPYCNSLSGRDIRPNEITFWSSIFGKKSYKCDNCGKTWK